jgi:acetyl esterase/lipase
MGDEATPFVPASPGGVGDRVVRWGADVALRASLLVSPRPAALLVRRLFAAKGARLASQLDRHAPSDLVACIDERYGGEADMLLDVVRPALIAGSLPLLVWVHGGGWVGGSKDELRGYCRLVASGGYVVAAPRYSLAPEHRYPTPLGQVMCALEYLQESAGRYSIDPARIAIAGDSAGAHIAAQIGALVTTPGYAEAVGVVPTVTAAQLRALVLACGPYDLGLLDRARTGLGRRFVKAVLWAYSGTRRFADDPFFATASVADHVTAAFPPVLITVGNGDPLRAQSELLVEKLRAQGVEPVALFYPDTHEPPLSHEYQFDLDTGEGQLFLECVLAFLHRQLTAPLATA